MASEEKAGTTESTKKFSGCFLVLMPLILVSVFLFVLFMGWQRSKLIKTFTQVERPNLLEFDLESVPARDLVRDLAVRLERFSASFDEGNLAVLELDARDLNLLFTTYEEFAALRGQLRPRRILSTGILCDAVLSFPGFPIIGERRYLEAELLLYPDISYESPELRISKITRTVGGELPSGFVESLRRRYDLSALWRDEPLVKYAHSLVSVELGKNVLLIRCRK